MEMNYSFRVIELAKHRLREALETEKIRTHVLLSPLCDPWIRTERSDGVTWTYQTLSIRWYRECENEIAWATEFVDGNTMAVPFYAGSHYNAGSTFSPSEREAILQKVLPLPEPQLVVHRHELVAFANWFFLPDEINALATALMYGACMSDGQRNPGFFAKT